MPSKQGRTQPDDATELARVFNTVTLRSHFGSSHFGSRCREGSSIGRSACGTESVCRGATAGRLGMAPANGGSRGCAPGEACAGQAQAEEEAAGCSAPAALVAACSLAVAAAVLAVLAVVWPVRAAAEAALAAALGRAEQAAGPFWQGQHGAVACVRSERAKAQGAAAPQAPPSARAPAGRPA
eukprot:9052683-Lingulodinium_polyedra.AAC.1